MNAPKEQTAANAPDCIQQRLTDYAAALNFDSLTPPAIHAAKVRVIDTLGGLVGGFFGEPCRIARELAARLPDARGATVIGTRMKTTPDMAAFVNATTARDVEMPDTYHWPGSAHGHASDMVMPILAVAEHMRVSGREFIAAIVLGYEVYLRISTVFHNRGFDHTNFSVIGSAVAAGKLMGLAPAQLAHCIAMAAVPNAILAQVRKGHLSMFRTAAGGQAGRAAVFAALLARAGMAGPHLPFEGKAGWCDHVARERFSFDVMGGGATPYKILDTRLKNRPCEGNAISHIMAAEKIAPLRNLDEVKKIIVETHQHALRETGIGEHQWNPESRETADHSAPYVVAATLMDGTVTLRSYNDAHLWNPQLRALMQKVVVVENDSFTLAYERLPVEHRTRVTVEMHSGERLVGESGGDEDDLSAEMSDAKVVDKFRGLTEDALGAKRVAFALDRLWNLEKWADVAVLPADYVIV